MKYKMKRNPNKVCDRSMLYFVKVHTYTNIASAAKRIYNFLF